MIYGRKGSVQLKIFRNKDNNEDSSNTSSSLNEEDKIDKVHEDDYLQNDVSDPNSRRNSINDKLLHIRNMKHLYLDSDDILNDNSDEFAIDDSVPLIQQTRKRHSSHSTISNPSYFNSSNDPDSKKRRASSVSSYKKLVELQPFKNKVGGHTEIFKFSARAICKTLLNKENEWYEFLEKEYCNNNEYCGTLLKYMPRYIGILNVRKSSIETEVNMNDNIHLFSKKLLEKYYIDVDPNELSIDYKHTNLNTKLKDQILSEVFDSSSKKLLNSDNDQLTEVPIETYPQKNDTEVTQYILLEDLTRKMKNATVLDLKMGTRQYGVFAIDKKQKSQRMKCQITTSLKLGCRVCGLKIYRPSSNTFIKKDKYFGRRIKGGWQFSRLILLFLYDGIAIRSIVSKIPKLINDLNKLIESIEHLQGYRMYGASLLFMYDHNDTECKVYIIDFAQCITIKDYLEKANSFTCPPKMGINNPDRGFIKGLKSLKFYLKNSWDILTGFNKDVETYFLSNGTFDQKKVLKYCNDDKFNLPFKWLDSFTEEREDSFNDANNEYRQKWNSYEQMFNLFPNYSDDEEIQSD
ncbi:uncharacterized protein HGUI_03687 [Hanseniaspora guilliermondii]|uniref:Kinase n=1 Tax=Hanseniaspora guilliermondii TaxID=56406 RepID=A0A1L0FPI8_9ASCO|nr:uncharacterized protein HGUI_03687 [Hanseniaspora guilliermondii]